MAKQFKPVVVTANDLIEGDSVYLSLRGWVSEVRSAIVAMSPQEAAALTAAGSEGESGNLVVEPYLVEVELDRGAPWPVLRREQIRAERMPTFPFGLDAVPTERRAA